jgi:hypothetical protein
MLLCVSKKNEKLENEKESWFIEVELCGAQKLSGRGAKSVDGNVVLVIWLDLKPGKDRIRCVMDVSRDYPTRRHRILTGLWEKCVSVSCGQSPVRYDYKGQVWNSAGQSSRLNWFQTQNSWWIIDSNCFWGFRKKWRSRGQKVRDSERSFWIANDIGREETNIIRIFQ